MVIAKPEHPSFPGLLDGCSPGQCPPAPGEPYSSPAVAGEGDRVAVEGEPSVPLETYEDDRCPDCGLEICACAQVDPELDDEPADQLVDWPIYSARPEPVEGACPEPVEGHPATAAFTRRRHELQDKHGTKACVHLSRPAETMARDARDRLQAVMDRTHGEPTAEQRELALHSLLSAGALCFALYEKLHVEQQ